MQIRYSRGHSLCPGAQAGAKPLHRRRHGRQREQRRRALNPPHCLGRKNWLFARSDKGSEPAAGILSLIETAKLNGMDPEAYLRTVLAMIADHLISRIDEPLPWNIEISSRPTGRLPSSATLALLKPMKVLRNGFNPRQRVHPRGNGDLKIEAMFECSAHTTPHLLH